MQLCDRFRIKFTFSYFSFNKIIEQRTETNFYKFLNKKSNWRSYFIEMSKYIKKNFGVIHNEDNPEIETNSSNKWSVWIRYFIRSIVTNTIRCRLSHKLWTWNWNNITDWRSLKLNSKTPQNPVEGNTFLKNNSI